MPRGAFNRHHHVGGGKVAGPRYGERLMAQVDRDRAGVVPQRRESSNREHERHGKLQLPHCLYVLIQQNGVSIWINNHKAGRASRAFVCF